MSLHNGIRKFFILLALPTIIWLYHNQMVNWHFHTMENGAMVKHAHPYEPAKVPGTPFQSHGHNSLEYSFLSLVYHSFPFLALLLALGFVGSQAIKVFFFSPRQVVASGHIRWPFLRGPPRMFSLN